MSKLIENIYGSSLKLLVPSTPTDLYKTIIGEATSLMKARWGTLFLGDGDALKRIYSSSPHRSRVKPRSRGFSYQAYITGKAKVLSREEVIKIHPELSKNKIVKSFIIIPLFYGNEPHGVLNLQSTHKVTVLTKTQLKGLQLFGSMASLAIRKTHAQYQAQKALETRDLFISMAAHELRTPLTVIKLYIQILNKRFNENSSTETKWVQKILKETNRTVHIINELLHIDQVRTGKLKFSQDIHSLRSVIKDAMSDSQLSYPDHLFEYHDQINGQSDLVVGDSNKLIQAFINLFNNAAKFSPLKSTISINLKSSGHYLEVVVSDKGMGIRKQELPHIFEAFYKGKQNETVEGMGLGLSLVDRIIKKSNGKIEISSIANKGTTVMVELPKAII